MRVLVQGKLCWVLSCLFAMLGFGKLVKRIANAPTLDEQKRLYDDCMIVRFVKHGPRFLVYLFCKVISFLLFNRVVLW